MVARFYSGRFALIFIIFLALVSLNGCVGKDVSYLKNRTSEIQADLSRLQKQIDQRLATLERRNGKYDYSSALLRDRHALDRFMDSMVIIETKTLFETDQTPGRLVKQSKGVGLAAGRYVLTLNHVVTQGSLQLVTPFGVIILPAKKIKETSSLLFRDRKLNLKGLVRDKKADIALLEIPANDLNIASFPCPLGNSDDIEVGNFVYVVGNPFDSGVNIREGIVSSLVGPQGIPELEATVDDLFTISNGVLPGDSGAPVLALRNGVPELVGIVQGTIGTTRVGWAIKINSIMKGLTKYLNREEFCVAQKEARS